MKKLILLLLIALIPLASAIEEGQNITQAQLDAFNPSNVNWQFLECQDEHDIWIDKPYILQRYSCFALREVDDYYQVYRDDYQIMSYIRDWKKCLLIYGSFPQCWDLYVENRIKPQVREVVVNTRQWVIDHQTDEETDELISLLQNYTIGDPE